MRFMMIVKANQDSEAGMPPDAKILAEMMQYNEELAQVGVLVDLAGLQPSSNGARVKFSGGKRLVMDGPFAETKELIAGYWLIRVNSRQEAIEWAKRAPAPFGEGKEAEIELRQVFELDDFAPSESFKQQAQQIEKQLANSH